MFPVNALKIYEDEIIYVALKMKLIFEQIVNVQ